MRKIYVYILLLSVSLMGTRLTDFVLGIWLLDLDKKGVALYSLTWFFSLAPSILLAPLISSIVDRWDKNKIIFFGQLIAGIGSLILMILYYFNALLPWYIFIITMISSICFSFVFKSFNRCIPEIVPQEKLIRTNGIISSIYEVIEIGVPIAAPIFYKTISLGNFFLIDFLTFIIPVTFFLMIKFPSTTRSNQALNLLVDFKIFSDFINRNKELKGLILYSMFTAFIIGMLNILFTPLILDYSNEYALSVIFIFLSLGGLSAGLVSIGKNRLSKTLNPIRLNIRMGFMISLILIISSIYFSIYAIALGGMCVLFLFNFSSIIKKSFFQTVIPSKIQGRVLGYISIFVGISESLAYLISGFIIDSLGGFLKNQKLRFIPNYTDTYISAAIILLFLLMGIFHFIISALINKKKKISVLDNLYKQHIL